MTPKQKNAFSSVALFFPSQFSLVFIAEHLRELNFENLKAANERT